MNKEEVYDAAIAPLMSQIIAICRANKIGMLASYAIPTPEDEGLHCTTHLPDESGELPDLFREAAAYTICNGQWKWTKDHNEALRFVRREDVPDQR